MELADTVAHTTEAFVEAKTHHKTALAEQLLTGRRRFPEFKGHPWRKARLRQFFREQSVRHVGPQPPTVLSCSTIYGIIPQSQRFSKPLASRDLARYKAVAPGDLVYDPMLLWDGSIAFSDYHGVVSPAYSTFTFCGDNADPRFFRYLFASEGIQHTYKVISQGTNKRRRKAPASAFLHVEISLPSHEEQSAIADTIELMDQEVSVLQAQLAVLKKQKLGLMQKLLNPCAPAEEETP